MNGPRGGGIKNEARLFVSNFCSHSGRRTTVARTKANKYWIENTKDVFSAFLWEREAIVVVDHGSVNMRLSI